MSRNTDVSFENPTGNYNVFILGAGFSKPAGLPLTTELFRQIIIKAREKELYHILERDINKYLEYLSRTNRSVIDEEHINFEDFISYLDVEHFLQLKGSDHWSDEGNKSQLLVRNLIALILNDAESAMTNEQFSLYDNFVTRLKPEDLVITFNYDTILEKAFSRKRINFRLFPTRYKKVSFGYGEPSDTKEIILLKMHGSINWFDISTFDNSQKALRQQSTYVRPKHEVFAEQKDIFLLETIISEPYPSDSPLRRLYWTHDISKYLGNCSYVLTSPFIVSPSHTKIVYLNPLTEFWRGFNNMGVGNSTVAIIGFSFPEYDEYVRQPLYHLVNNFQNNYYYSQILTKTNLKIVDFKKTTAEIDDYKKKWAFVDWNKTDTYFKGFDMESLDIIFPNTCH